MFYCADAALRWAYAMEGRAVLNQTQAYARRRTGANSQWEGWSVWDRHAQAAAVRRRVEELGSPLAELAIATLGRLETRYPAAQVLVAYLEPPEDHLEAYELMVEQYVLGSSRQGGGGIDSVRRALGCRKATALGLRRMVFARLDGLRRRLLDEIEDHLRSGGLLSHAKTETAPSLAPSVGSVSVALAA